MKVHIIVEIDGECSEHVEVVPGVVAALLRAGLDAFESEGVNPARVAFSGLCLKVGKIHAGARHMAARLRGPRGEA